MENLNLNEEKRYVRRYYARPINEFASNKSELIKILIDAYKAGQNCTIYSLINLGDEKDITKLTNDDIIYKFDDGVLVDKNDIPVFDYDLSIKHEEQRDKINPDKVSDATFKDVYDDRMTDRTGIDEQLTEDKIFVGKLGQELDLPSDIHLLSQKVVENAIDKLEPEEPFAVGYVNPVFMYKELWDYLPIYKCTEMVGYTGVDFEGSEDAAYTDKQARIDRAKDEIQRAKNTGSTFEVGSTVDYSMQNKLVRRYNRVIPGNSMEQNTILFYPTGAPKVKYYVKLPTQPDFITVTADQLEQYIYDNISKIENQMRQKDPAKIRSKVRTTLFGKSEVDVDRETRDERALDPKYIYKYGRDKHSVRSLYTSQIYYFHTENEKLGHSLTEALIKEAFDCEFDDINAYGEKLVEGKATGGICCICGEEIDGFGNNPEPYMSAENGERCCDACNAHFVIPARLAQNIKNE